MIRVRVYNNGNDSRHRKNILTITLLDVIVVSRTVSYCMRFNIYTASADQEGVDTYQRGRLKLLWIQLQDRQKRLQNHMPDYQVSALTNYITRTLLQYTLHVHVDYIYTYLCILVFTIYAVICTVCEINHDFQCESLCLWFTTTVQCNIFDCWLLYFRVLSDHEKADYRSLQRSLFMSPGIQSSKSNKECNIWETLMRTEINNYSDDCLR